MLFAARGNAPLIVYFTYPIGEIDAARRIDWAKEQAKEKKKGKKTRPSWSPKKHALGAFFASRRLAAGQQIVEMSNDGESQVIDLLDPLGL